MSIHRGTTLLAVGLCLAAYFGARWLMDSSREGRVDETLSVNPPIVLLKNIAAGEKAIVKLSLTNLGTQPVTISRVVPDCSCTSAILSSRHAERGQSLGLEISVLGRPDLAMTEKYITLVYEDDSSQQIPIRITNVSPASLSPASLDFGRVERSELPASRKIRLSRAAVSTPERIDMAFQDSVQGLGVTLERMDDSFIYFSVEINDAVPLGEFSTHLILSDKGREFRRSVPVYGVVRGAYFASPSSVVLVLPYALPTSIESSTVRVVSRTSDDRQRFTIGVAEVSDSLAGWLETDLKVDGEVSIRFRQGVLPLAAFDRLSGNVFVEVKVDGQGSELVSIPVSVLRQ